MTNFIFRLFAGKSKFNWIDKTLLVFCFLGAFDDIRQSSISQSSGDAGDWPYNPEFLYGSVILPSFSIGRVLAKKFPKTPAINDGDFELLAVKHKDSDDKKARDVASKRARKGAAYFDALGLLFSLTMADDILGILKDLKQADIDKIEIYKVIPKAFLDKNKKEYFFGPVTRITKNYAGEVSATKNTPMLFKVSNKIQIVSAVLKMLPLSYLGVPLDKAGRGLNEDEKFCCSLESLESMFPQAFWEPRGLGGRKNYLLKETPPGCLILFMI